MVSLNKSFLYGIGFASITWTISLYLYWQLNKTNNVSLSSTHNPVNNLPQFYKQKLPEENFREQEKSNIFKDTVLKKPKFENYINSNKLMKELEPKKILKSKDEEVLDELGMVRTIEDKELRDEGYKLYSFNVLVSNKLSFHRQIPDTRNKLCKDVIYSTSLPTASIIICFYNEHFATLLRTIYSIMDRTPENLLKEIILIDDFSDVPNLHSNLSNFFNQNLDLKEKVRLFKTDAREGLIRARMFGANKATGKVLIFLDSHIEVNIDWVQPLLNRVHENRSNIAIPVIDIVNADTFSYSASPLVRGGFNWGLHFKWENLPVGTLAKTEDFIKPIKSPTMAGGLFAIDREYFMHLGEYDAGMDIWGGENLEISFRTWMCGGRLDILPCSRVGHVFRKRRPYGSPDGKDTMTRNSLRVASVWMDGYKEYFLKQRPDAVNVKYGDVTDRMHLRQRLKCNDFNWYLKHVYPELTLPSDTDVRLRNKWSALEQDKFQPWHSRKRNYIDNYQLRLTNTTLCVQSSKDVKSKGSSLILKPCVKGKHQVWYQTDRNELVLQQLLCLQSGQSFPYLYKCHEMGGNQEWKHTGEFNTPIYNMAAGTCIGVDEVKIGAKIKMKLCTDQSLNTWDLFR